ncbi:hypothetical protein, partial [Ectothiorhodospira lacustris]|uniref:hypothetical protein n=1 Tax=Ectothiorhodospira lacustris TaxID=2899127 RepID=UPI001EE92116
NDMSLTIDKKFSSKRVSIALVAAWVVSIAATLLIGNAWIALGSMFLGGALPFVLLAIWLPQSRLGKFIKEAASVWQLRIFGVGALFAYSIYASKWARGVINKIFHVDPGHFGISTTLLAVLYAPFGLIYRQDVIGWLWVGFILLGTLLTYVLPLSLLTPNRPALGWKAWVGSVLFILVGAFFLTMSFHLASSFEPLVERFAVWADFHENHLCTNVSAQGAEAVVFIGGDQVLAYFPDNHMGSRFSVESCNYR